MFAVPVYPKLETFPQVLDSIKIQPRKVNPKESDPHDMAVLQLGVQGEWSRELGNRVRVETPLRSSQSPDHQDTPTTEEVTSLTKIQDAQNNIN